MPVSLKAFHPPAGLLKITRLAAGVAFLWLGWFCIPAFAEADAAGAPASGYRMRPGDVVRVTVFNEPDLNVEQKLDPEGVLIVPLLGRTSLHGLTVREAEAHLEHRFRDDDYLIRPQVTVSVTQYAQQVFYIFGEVRSPGAKAFPPGRQSIDIFEAITMAGDLSQYARRNEVILRRPIPGSGTEEKFTLDLDRMMRGTRRGETALVDVYPDDIIFVPQRIF